MVGLIAGAIMLLLKEKWRNSFAYFHLATYNGTLDIQISTYLLHMIIARCPGI